MNDKLAALELRLDLLTARLDRLEKSEKPAEAPAKLKRPGRTPEPVRVEALDFSDYERWAEKHPAAREVSQYQIFDSAAAASKWLGYSPNYVACQLSGQRFAELGCGVTVCYLKNIPGL